MIHEKTFNIVIERYTENNWLVAEVGELPGCYTQAPDMPTLKSNIKEAIRAYLLTADPSEPLPDFMGTWRVEHTVRPDCDWQLMGTKKNI